MVSMLTLAVAVFVVVTIGSAWLVRRSLKGGDAGSAASSGRGRRRQSKGARSRDRR